MPSFVNTLIIIVSFVVSLFVVQMVMNFFSVSYADYSIYMYWIIALFILHYILPKRYSYFTNN